jgi:parallel beta-helix repeat protein
MRCLSYLLLACFFLFVAQSLHATIIHVPDDSTTIQGGINGAEDGDTVLVAPGTYYEHWIDFNGKAITVMGTAPEDSAIVASTIIDANSQSRVFYFHSGEDSTSVLAGLTITGGDADWGGGLSFANSSPKIIKNIIRENVGNIAGGGIICTLSSAPLIIENIITSNTSLGDGGGIFCSESSPAILSNVISNNISEENGGGICCFDNSSPTISSNTIRGNQADKYDGGGGGIYCQDLSQITISNNVISENIAM